ncbi:30S ribosomal protein S9 [Candidatus Woesearchaeota archaeon]|nr:30S ribosomal protein S9 [Candidatus Woesearchaeota archaeon]
MKAIITSGKRKSAIATAALVPGNGIVRINHALLSFHQPEPYRLKISEPLIIAAEVAKRVDINLSVTGGGQNAQAEAARLAVGRALVQFDKNLVQDFLKYDRTLLVADVRRKETRKPNCHGKARAKRQTSYR